jgi:two-component system, chemotaxis family, chemotaxis protein CheY
MAKKVLLVDDSMVVRRQMEFAIKQAGYEVVTGANGRLGIETLEKNPDVVAIISDINMPEMNGLEMILEIKERNLSSAPIFVVTTEGTEDMLTKGKAAGVKGWLVKPVNPVTLVEVLNKVCG